MDFFKQININKLDFVYGYYSLTSKNYLENGWILDNNFKQTQVYLKYNNPIGLAKYKNYLIIKNIAFEQVSDTEYYVIEYYIIEDKDQLKLEIFLSYLNDTTLKIHNLLCIWGANRNPKILDNLSRLQIDSKFKKSKKQLYRGLSLSDKALDKLFNKESISLKKRKYSSWSENLSEAMKFSVEYANKGIVLKYTPKDEILININLFETMVFKTLKWYQYFFEKEIILINSQDMLIVNPNDVKYVKGDYTNPKQFKIKANSEDILQEVVNIIKKNKVEWEYGVNIPLKNIEIWWMEEISSFKKDNKDFLPTKTYGKFIHKNFTILKEIYFESKKPSYSYCAVKDTEVVFKKKLPITNREIKIEGLLFQWGDKASDRVGEQIENLISDDYTAIDSEVLYRGLNLSPAAHKKLLNNEPITLDNRKYSSWSHKIESAKHFARIRPVIIKYFPIKKDILLNINLFNREVFGNEEIYYHSHEDEVILKNSPGMLTINPDQIVEGVL